MATVARSHIPQLPVQRSVFLRHRPRSDPCTGDATEQRRCGLCVCAEAKVVT